jgi:hypothetical protein
MVARTTPTGGLDISPLTDSTEADSGVGERSGPLARRDVRSAHRSADGSRKAGWSILRQARACDFRALLRPSVRTRGMSLNMRPSRCSLDLWPLRGLPVRPLGKSPPLMCLLGQLPRRPKTRWRMALRHFRVSIRPNLGATPKTDSNPLGVCNLFRPPETLRRARASPRLPFRRKLVQARASSADRRVSLVVTTLPPPK